MRGFSVRNMKYMRALAEAYPSFAIEQPAIVKLQQADRELKLCNHWLHKYPRRTT